MRTAITTPTANAGETVAASLQFAAPHQQARAEAQGGEADDENGEDRFIMASHQISREVPGDDAAQTVTLAAISQRAVETGVPVEFTHEIDTHPAEAIVRLADRLKCDLIVMSSHGRRGVRRFVLGSQTAEVVTHTTIPVLVIR